MQSNPNDADIAQSLLSQHGLEGQKTLAIFPGGQSEIQDYAALGDALRPICREMDLRVVALGSAAQADLNQTVLQSLGDRGVNLAGQTTAGQAAEILRRSRLAIGANQELARSAQAVSTPHVLILGGGRFAQELPKSPLATVVCLPLNCYGCDWKCKYDAPHCVRGILPAVIEVAVRAALAGVSDLPRVFVQDRSLWPGQSDLPQWAWFHSITDRTALDVFAVGKNYATGRPYTQSLKLPRRVLPSTGGQRIEPALAQNRLAAARLCLESPDDVLHRIYPAQIAPLIRKTDLLSAPAPQELFMLDEIRAGLLQEPPGAHWLQYRIAAMLYFSPHELPAIENLDWIPAWLLDDFINWSLHPPRMFYEPGEADRFLRWQENWTALLHRTVLDHPDSPLSKRIALLFLMAARYILAYFNEANVKTLYSHRAELMEFALKQACSPLEHIFAPRPAGRKIRLGILAGSFHASAETSASLPFYEFLGDEFEVTLYCMTACGQPIEAYCRSRAKAFKVLPRELPAQVAAIRADDLDLLLFATNVAAVSNQASVLALHRLARVQWTTIFNIVSTGMPKMDVYLSGQWTDPAPDAASHYREKLVQIDGSVHCFSQGNQAEPAGAPIERSRLGIAPDAVVFATGANFFKLIPELLHAWAKILAQAPQTVLMLFPYGLNWDNAYPKAAHAAHISDIFAGHGVKMDRVKIVDPQPPPDRWGMKKLFKMGDVYLDSFPFCGSTSLMEPLEIGLPIVAKRGAQLRGAMAAAMLREISLDELAVETTEQYIALAVRLATDAAYRRQISAKISAAMAGTPRFADSRLYAKRIAPVLSRLAGADTV